MEKVNKELKDVNGGVNTVNPYYIEDDYCPICKGKIKWAYVRDIGVCTKCGKTWKNAGMYKGKRVYNYTNNN